MNNGTSTGYFKLERGTRQGDPPSPYLFVLALKTLFIQVRSNRLMKGFRIKKCPNQVNFICRRYHFFVRDSHSLQIILKLMK